MAMTFCLKPARNVVTCHGPDSIRHVLIRNGANYLQTTTDTPILQAMLGSGLLTSEGSFWTQQRRALIRSIYLFQVERALHQIQRSFSDLRRRWQTHMQTGLAFDIGSEMHGFTLDMVGHMFFGVNLADRAKEIMDFVRTLCFLQHRPLRRRGSSGTGAAY